MSNTKGITYYKLESKYDGDITKYCGLSGNEIDANFFFLRGNDIKSAYWNEKCETLVLVKVNGEKIVVEGIKNKIDTKGSYFDPVKAVLHLSINGVDTAIAGMKLTTTVHTDDTLTGDGTLIKPLGESHVNRTGFYKTAESLIDLTTSGETLPDNAEKGDRYLTAELVSPYGLLYSYEGVKAIQQILKDQSSPWRVPTIEEWSEMLNAVEICPEDRTHKSTKSNVYLGKHAGAFLKSRDGSWDYESGDEIKDRIDLNSYNFKALPAGVIAETERISFSKIAEFWSCSMADTGDVWTKKFHGDKNTVQQRSEEVDLMLSVRLVRDLIDNYADTEVINGISYECTLMPYITDKGVRGNRVWTVQNVSFNELLIKVQGERRPKALHVQDKQGNVTSSSTEYFINEWNGKSWDKKHLADNDIIVLQNGPDGSDDEEWQVMDGVLVKRWERMYEKVLSAMTDYIDEQITSAITMHDQDMEELVARHDKEIGELWDETKRLDNAIAKETSERKEADKKLQEEIEAETERATSAETYLDLKIDAEVKRAEEAEKDLQRQIDEANSALTEETERALAAESAITDELRQEEQDRWDNDIQQEPKNPYIIRVAEKNCLVLLTNDGHEIKVGFNGNYGEVNFHKEKTNKQ